MSGKFLAAFSNTGRYYAHISDDGKLRIWDVQSCTLKQEYTPDVNLTSPFTDLHWILSSKKVNFSSGNRKRKSTNVDSENEYLLLGSRSSDVFLYSVSSYSIVSTYKNGHTSQINNISWCRNHPDVFFTCSKDHYVIQWDIETCSVKRKWKCGKISSITVSDDGQSVVTAMKELKWWDISGEKETLLKTFIGQSTDIHSLTFVRICGEPCVLSAASGNRLIHAWLLNHTTKDRGALATFAMDDALVSISVRNISSGGVAILASSHTGILQVYECTKNGKKLTQPVKPKLSIQIGAESDQEKAQVDQIPIVGATFCDENAAYIAYGTDTVLSFEKLELNSSEQCMIIVRQDPKKKLTAGKEQSANKILPTSSNKNVQYVPPDAVNGFFTPGSRKPVKRSQNASKSLDVPLEQRLENLIVEVPSTVTAPTSDSLVHLLLQGLRSKDSRILHDVLINKEENVIRTTIGRLPVEAIVPLSVELIGLLQGKRSGSDSAVKWLKCIMMVHAAHLISNPEVTEIFAPIFPFIESRLNVIGPLYRLVGRLDLMIEQIKHRTDESERSLQSVSLQPKLIYQDEDSDEDEEEDNDLHKEDSVSNDDSDHHWEEMSEIDVDSGQEQGPDEDMDNIDS